jgi:hypothetical protein
MPPSRFEIEGLDWDEENQAHVEVHIDWWQVDELLEGGDYHAFPNTKGHPPGRWLFTGRTEAGAWVTAVMQQPNDGSRIWRPVTAWPSTSVEQRRYDTEARRLAKGRKRP